jgi:exopolysaccharide biosynthesis polyprenyl glycosylphosphotransferase
MHVTAVIGDRAEADAAGMGHLWRATYLDAGPVVSEIEADAVIMCSADIDPILASSLTRSEHRRHRAVYVDPGLSGFDIRRFQATHIAHQPLLEVDSMSLAVLQHAVKRMFDIVVSGLIAVIAAPVMILIAVLIKLEDHGPVFFKQERVGFQGRTFGMLKFRTMVPNAEALLAQLKADNERSGPLFKMERDPRITKIGHFLRATSLDELPQLLNVLQGTMSLVGPRPALQSEVEDFDDVLKTRNQVVPGITGLWQVEARDNPSFAAYRRLDLFYVENWSLAFDVKILLKTIGAVFRDKNAY